MSAARTRRGLLATTVVAVVAALLVVVLGEPSSVAQQRAAAVQQRTVAAFGFERAHAGWSAGNTTTRLDRVRSGHAGSRYAARLRPPVGRGATVELTDSKAFVRGTDRAETFRVTVWVRTPSPSVRAKLLVRERRNAHTVASSWDTTWLGSRTWRPLTVRYTMRSTSSVLDIRVIGENLRSGQSLLVDDVRGLHSPLPTVTPRLLGRTNFGKTVYNPNTSWDDAVRRADKKYGRLDIIRVFYPGFPTSWPGPAGSINRPVPVSFRIAPNAVLAGNYDDALRRWFKDAPRDRTIWWTYMHEPEDDIEGGQYSATAYRAAWRHINQIAAAVDKPNLRPTLTLMCWTLSPNSGRSFSDYYPGNFIKTFAWDCYNQSWWDGRYRKPADMVKQAASFSHRHGKGFAIAELGTRLLPGDDGTGRAAWLIGVAKAAARVNAQYVSYFDTEVSGGDFRLNDLPSQMAWRRVIRAS